MTEQELARLLREAWDNTPSKTLGQLLGRDDANPLTQEEFERLVAEGKVVLSTPPSE